MTAQEKQDILEMLNNAPEKMTVDDFLEETHIIMKSMEGLAQWERGESTPKEEVLEGLKKWLQ